MGDRAVVKLVGRNAPIYLYTHWSGLEFPEMLRKALAVAQPRWGDESYCNRILIGELFFDLFEEHSETGGGISTYPMLGEYATIEVRYITQTISVEGEPDLYSFEEYASLSDIKWSQLDEGLSYTDDYYG